MYAYIKNLNLCMVYLLIIFQAFRGNDLKHDKLDQALTAIN